MNITLDEAVEAFRETRSFAAAQALITIAREYHEDGMIEDGTLASYIEEANSAFDRPEHTGVT